MTDAEWEVEYDRLCVEMGTKPVLEMWDIHLGHCEQCLESEEVSEQCKIGVRIMEELERRIERWQAGITAKYGRDIWREVWEVYDARPIRGVIV
jgi:hypothetical protein